MQKWVYCSCLCVLIIILTWPIFKQISRLSAYFIQDNSINFFYKLCRNREMRTKYNRMFTEQPCVKKPMKYDNPFTRVISQITVYVLGIKNHQTKFYVKKGQCSFHVFPLLSNTYYDIELIDFGPQIEQTLSSF